MQVLVEFDARCPSSGIVYLTSEVGAHLRQSSIILLSDEEVRVRIAAGDLLGALGRKYGVSIYEDSKGIQSMVYQREGCQMDDFYP